MSIYNGHIEGNRVNTEEEKKKYIFARHFNVWINIAVIPIVHTRWWVVVSRPLKPRRGKQRKLQLVSLTLIN
jgi:hypothetical protein